MAECNEMIYANIKQMMNIKKEQCGFLRRIKKIFDIFNLTLRVHNKKDPFYFMNS